MRKIMIPLVALLALGACQTVAGAGRDMTDAGHAVTHQANKTQAQM